MTSLDIQPELLTVSHSQISSWSACQYKWHLGYELGYTPKRHTASINAGSLIHKFLQGYYEDVKTDISDIDVLVSNHNERIRSVVGDNPDLLDDISYMGALIHRYIRDYAPFADLEWETLEVEKHVQAEFVTPKGRKFALQGYVDRLKKHRNSGRIWQEETKSVYQTRWWTPTQMMMDQQQSFYNLMLQLMGIPVFGIQFNMLNYYKYKDWKNTPIEKLFHRDEVSRTEFELEEIAHNVGSQVDQIIDAQHYTDADAPTRTRNLSRFCDQCWYQEPCLLAMKGIPIESAMETGFRLKTSFDEAQQTQISAGSSDNRTL